MNAPGRFAFVVSVAVALFFALFVCFALWWPSQAHGQIPGAAEQWRGYLIAAADEEWGAGAPVATFGAQVEQESAWNPRARSPVGAAGLAQFMGPTATWLASLSPRIGNAEPLSPTWALRALVSYDRYLFDRMVASDGCEQMAFALSAYNGGEKFLRRGIALCSDLCDPRKWFSHVELVDDGRAIAAWTENRGYPLKVLLVREPKYIAAGWGPGQCTTRR